MTTMETIGPPEGYRAGACNIGPAEIRARRRAGHVGLVATAALLAVLVVADAPTWTRLALALPAGLAAGGYLQAAMRFCAAFGWAGTFNFSERLRDTETVAQAEARAADRRRAVQIVALSAVAGASTAVGAMVLPV